MSDKTPGNYREAREELDDIVAKLEKGNVDIDQLAGMVRRAHELGTFCSTHVRAADEEIARVTEALAGDTAVPSVLPEISGGNI